MTTTIPWTVSEIAEATGGTILAGDGDALLQGVSIDSRSVAPGNLFVAIEGERHDGHAFVADTVAAGAGGALVSRRKAGGIDARGFQGDRAALIAADDTVESLGDLAARNRERAGISVVGITGSNGKTTTRKMTAAVFAKRFPTLATSGNFNNEIGLPLTLLRLGPEHRWAVLEMGANHPGEIAALSRICRPDVGIVTNVGPAHLEFFGSLEGVASAKGELAESLGPGGVAVLNADDERVSAMAARTPAKVLLYGTAREAQIRATDVESSPRETSFTLETPKERVSVRLAAPGAFMVSNALAAAAAGYAAGIGASETKAALETDFRPVSGRMNIRRTPEGVNVLDDTYNANPDSMRAALEALETLGGGGRRVFVAGDMFELGEHAPALHEELGRLAARSGIDRLYAAGEHAERVAEGAAAAGMAAGGVLVGEKEEILIDLKRWLRPGDWVLVKGSRGMRMERIVDGLRREAGD